METILYAARPFVALFAIYAMLLVAVVALTWPQMKAAYAKASPVGRGVFFVAVAGITLYGGSKARIYFPYTDPTTRYLVDAGSYVTNDWVHIAFTKSILVPQSANFFIDKIAAEDATNANWEAYLVNAYSNTFANVPTTFNHICEGATNYDWYVYTDWTPPPVVHTNGVAYVVWQQGGGTNRLTVTRTGVYFQGERLAPNPAMTNLPPFTPTVQTANPNEN